MDGHRQAASTPHTSSRSVITSVEYWVWLKKFVDKRTSKFPRIWSTCSSVCCVWGVGRAGSTHSSFMPSMTCNEKHWTDKKTIRAARIELEKVGKFCNRNSVGWVDAMCFFEAWHMSIKNIVASIKAHHKNARFGLDTKKRQVWDVPTRILWYSTHETTSKAL